jgi:hypothetical protein
MVLAVLAAVVPVLAILLVLRKVGRIVQAKGRGAWPYQLLALVLILVGAAAGTAAGAYVVLEIMEWKSLSWAGDREPVKLKPAGDREGKEEDTKESREAKLEEAAKPKEVKWWDENKSPIAVIYFFGLLCAAIGAGHGLLFAHDAKPVDASALGRLPEPAAGQPQVRLRARFQRRMKPRHVSPVFVELREPVHGRAATADAPLLLHLSVPGAQVAPGEVALDPSQPGARAMFQVTPLAYGWLNQARLEVRHRGQLVQQMPLAIRGSGHAVTWFLAALTLLVPAFVLYATQYHKLEGTIHRPPAPHLQQEPAQRGPGVQAVGPRPLPGNPKDKNTKTADKAPAKAAPDARPGQPGELLEREILGNVYPIPYVTQPMARFLGIAYDYACMWSAPREQYLAFWIALFLAALTFASWVRHLGFYTRQVSRPISLAPAVGEVYAARTVTRKEEEPIRIVPVKD